MSCFCRAYVTWYRYTLSYAQKWPMLLLCSCSCSCSCLRLFSCTHTQFYFWFRSSPANVIILSPVLNRCTWILFYFLEQTTVFLVKVGGSELQNHFCTKSESNMYPVVELESCSTSWNKQLFVSKKLKLCIAKSLLNKIWKDYLHNAFTQDIWSCPSCCPSSTPAQWSPTGNWWWIKWLNE